MPTALEVAQSTNAFLAGEDPGPEYRTKYNNTNIVGYTPGGSQNIPLLHARNALIYHHHRKEYPKVRGILDAWVEYSKCKFMTTETFSCNIYFAWILESITVAHAFAVHHRYDAAKEGLVRHLNTAAALCALSSGWIKIPGGPHWLAGYPCSMTGARSWNGPAEYMLSSSSFPGGWVGEYLGMEPATWINNGLVDLLSRYSFPFVYSPPFVDIIRNKGKEGDYAEMQAVLDAGPRSLTKAKIFRTDKSVFWGNITSINTGSTCWLPGKGWTTGKNECLDMIYDAKDPRSMWLSVDRPRRKWGVKGEGMFYQNDEGLYYAAQRVGQRGDKHIPRNSWWNETTGTDETGFRNLHIPGHPLVEVDIHPNGYKITLEGDPPGNGNGGPPPPPPPPSNGGGWHTIVMDKAHLKFRDAEAVEALKIINDGGNHLPIHEVAFLPEELAEIKYELERIVNEL